MPALPTPTLLTATIPYPGFNTTIYLYVPTISSPAAPTLAEFNAGKNLTAELQTLTGFSTSQSKIDVPRAGSGFTGSLPGRTTADDSSMTFYLSTAGPTVDVRSVFTTNGQTGYIVIANEGWGTSGTPNKCDIFPIRVGSISVPQTLDESPKIAMIGFFIYNLPSTNITIPTV